jgi:four helix bundle protein
MKIKQFEDIIAWQKAQDLTVEIYASFKTLKDFGFRDQICRAAVSISNNIAEGFDRSSNADFSRFLYISLSSCSEVKSMLYLAERLKYLDVKSRDNLINKTVEVSRIITGFIKSLTPNN